MPPEIVQLAPTNPQSAADAGAIGVHGGDAFSSALVVPMMIAVSNSGEVDLIRLASQCAAIFGDFKGDQWNF